MMIWAVMPSAAANRSLLASPVANSASSLVASAEGRVSVRSYCVCASTPGESVQGMLPLSTYSLSAQLALRSRNQLSV
ncbi:hypothetical protein D3C87_1924330 [compost metagenome]